MFTSSQTLRAFFSLASMALLLASTAAGQDKTSAPRQNLLAGVTPKKTSVAQDSLFDFMPPRMKPMGLIPPSDRGENSMSPDVNAAGYYAAR